METHPSCHNEGSVPSRHNSYSQQCVTVQHPSQFSVCFKSTHHKNAEFDLVLVLTPPTVKETYIDRDECLNLLFSKDTRPYLEKPTGW